MKVFLANISRFSNLTVKIFGKNHFGQRRYPLKQSRANLYFVPKFKTFKIYDS